jgi:subtilisin family serine protease
VLVPAPGQSQGNKEAVVRAKRSISAAFAALALAAGLVTASGAAPTAARSAAGPAKSRNPIGIVVIRFKAGTSAATMKNAIAAAGGVVTTDLSKIGWMAATSRSSTFTARLRADKSVSALASDKINQSIDPDTKGAGGGAGKSSPALGNGPLGPPDPWHNLPSFLGETNPEGILQWDDNRMNVPAAWPTGKGAGVKVAVIDSGVQGSHMELHPNYDNQNSTNTIPCNTLTTTFGNAIVKAFGLKDCSSQDTDGHGTWVAGRILGAANGFASNGVAPQATVVGYKAQATGFGGLTSWIVDAMIQACDADVDLINMSLGGYDDPFDPTNPNAAADEADYAIWVAAVDYCRARGTAIFASAGNEHVKIDDYTVPAGSGTFGLLDGLSGVGRVDTGNEGIASVLPGTATLSKYAEDVRGMLEAPAGVPGVVMVSATNNAIGGTVGDLSDPNAKSHAWADSLKDTVRDQLAYYSNYGSRIDLAAPGGARKFNIPRYDIGDADILYGGWGTLGALDPSGELCTDPENASVLTYACFKVQGAGFGWLQGTSMSTPNATGVAALTLAAHPSLLENPSGLLAKLQATARKNMVNLMGPNDPADTSISADGDDCTTGWCHIERSNPIGFSDAYGAGIVNAGAAVG